MIVDFEKSEYVRDEIFDTCIVGAGAAGLTLAHELLEAGKSVALLEGGGLSRWERRSQALNRSYFSGLPFDGAHAGRFRGVGGTTSAWAGQIMELDEIDFEKRQWVPGSSWPISKSDLIPFYRARLSLRVSVLRMTIRYGLKLDYKDLILERSWKLVSHDFAQNRSSCAFLPLP